MNSLVNDAKSEMGQIALVALGDGNEQIESSFGQLLVVDARFKTLLATECLINEKQTLTIEQIQQWSHQILYGLIYLQEKQIHARNLSLQNIRLTQSV